jgi:hypothetical protein
MRDRRPGVRVAAAVVASVLLALLLVATGRWEARRHAAEENDGIARLVAEIGRLDQPQLSGYRRHTIFDCLTYRRGANPFALELCMNGQGRVIEAIDRRRGDPDVWSLRDDPARATNRVDRQLVDRLLRRMDAPNVPVG